MSADVHITAREVAVRVWLKGVETRASLTGHGNHLERVEAWISHAGAMKWVVDDGNETSPGAVNPTAVATESMEEPSFGGWTTRLFRR